MRILNRFNFFYSIFHIVAGTGLIVWGWHKTGFDNIVGSLGLPMIISGIFGIRRSGVGVLFHMPVAFFLLVFAGAYVVTLINSPVSDKPISITILLIIWALFEWVFLIGRIKEILSKPKVKKQQPE